MYFSAARSFVGGFYFYKSVKRIVLGFDAISYNSMYLSYVSDMVELILYLQICYIHLELKWISTKYIKFGKIYMTKTLQYSVYRVT